MGNCQCTSKDDLANPYLCRPSQIIWQSEFAKEVADAVVADADDDGDPLAYFPGRISSNGATKIASLFTQQGRKGINQDAMLVWEDFGSCEGTILCGVFDGHGPYGHHVAQTVRDSLPSKLFCQWHASLTHRKQDSAVQLSNVNNEFPPKMNDLNGIIPCEANKGFRDALDCNGLSQEPDSFSLWRELHAKAFKVMDKELKLHPTVDCFCSGATAVTVIKQGRDLIIANVGDSRAIIATQDDDGTLIAEQLTVDLKPNLPEEEERIMQSRGRVFALQDEPEVYRVWLPYDDSPGLAMARAFGDFCLKDYGVVSDPKITYRRVTNRDVFIILATDGVWDVLGNQEAVDIVASSSTRMIAARTLVESAVDAWKSKHPSTKVDDCAVVCLFLDSTFW